MIEEKNPFVPLTSDGIFKALFRNERYLKDFLEDVLKEKIEGLTYLDTYLEKEDKDTKESFLDVLVKYADGNYVIVEMQKYKKGSMITRMFYYLGKLAYKTLKDGEDYNSIKKFIGIGVLDYNDTNFEKLHNICRLYDVDAKKEVTDMLEIHMINLQSKKKNDKLKWIKLFKEEKEWNMSKYSDEELKAAVKELKRLSGDPEISAVMDKEFKEKLDIKLMKTEFTEEGRAEGLAEGLAKGKTEGKKEKEKEDAIAFHKNGASDELICKSLNITQEKLEHILKENDENESE